VNVQAGVPSHAGTAVLSGIPHDPLRRVRHVGWLLLGLQLAAMLAFSTLEYHRYGLSVGFGTYTQAWTGIAHGHLDPFSTLIAKPFWRNDAEFMVWPLALLYHVYPHPIDLLWVQDLAVVLTEAVAFGWILRVVRAANLPDRGRLGANIGLGAAVVMVANPFAYQTIAYDFHSEVLSALFIVLAGRALWSGRTRQLWWWVPLALATNALAGLYLVGVGLAAVVAGRRSARAGPAGAVAGHGSPRAGLVVIGAGLAWLVVVSLLGGTEYGYAHSLNEWYGYLLGPHPGSVRSYDVALGVLAHPAAATHMALSRWPLVLQFLLAVGLVGIASAWAWPVAAVVIIPSALNANVAFLNPHASFQTWPALPFVLVGSVMVLVRLLGGAPQARRIARGVVAAWAVCLVVLAGVLVPDVPRFWLAVDPPAAAELARVDAAVPNGAEVIASWGVVGRFAVREHVYAYGPLSRSFPVDRHTVAFVLAPGQGVFEVPRATALKAVTRARRLPGARLLAASHGVYAIVWRPPPGTTRVRLP
jgi:hypothetical protein